MADSAKLWADLNELFEEDNIEVDIEVDDVDVDDVDVDRFMDIMHNVEDAESRIFILEYEDGDPDLYQQVISDLNALLAEIENQIFFIYNFIRDKYRFRFPELESIVNQPTDYARVVKLIGNHLNPLVDDLELEGVLPSAMAMVFSITASTTSGKPLSEQVLRKTLDACDRVLALDSAKKRIVDFVGTRTNYIAPNLSAVVGSGVAARLMATAGGLTALAQMPDCNVRLLGAAKRKNNLAGFSKIRILGAGGYMEQTEIFQSTPPYLRTRTCRLLAAKSALAARVDSTGGDPTGKTGRFYREEIRKKIDKWQEPPPAMQPKPLPVPDCETKKKKRGGRRQRKRKERYAMTDTRKLANRMLFGVPEETSLGYGLGEGYGMLGAQPPRRNITTSNYKMKKQKLW